MCGSSLYVRNLLFKQEESEYSSQNNLLKRMNMDTKIIEQLEAAFSEEFRRI